MTVSFSHCITVSLAALVLVLLPGPNMMYLLAQTISNGVKTGIISLIGIVAAFTIYLMVVAFGISSILDISPKFLNILRVVGAAYLFWIAIGVLNKNFQDLNESNQATTKKFWVGIFLNGFLINILNPKVALFYCTVIPQFIEVDKGRVFLQVIILGFIQIFISFSVDLIIVLLANNARKMLRKYSYYFTAHRWLSFMVLSCLSIKMVI